MGFSVWRRAALTLGAFAIASLPCFGQPAKSAPIFGQIEQITSELSAITGWKAKRKVPSEILTREQFRKYVESQTDGQSKRKAIHAEETALKMFGLVPPDFRLREELVDLLDEQAAAFYDYRRKRLYVLSSTREGEDQRAALIHELAHALADQQHPLGKYLDGAGDDNDAATAREAVMEGQATWLTWAYEAKQITGRAEISPRMLAQLLPDDDTQSAGFPVLSAAPLYVRESLLFPYNAGARFQDAIFRKLGQRAFEQVFAKGPSSTQQILHPDDYIQETMHANPAPLALDKAAGLRPRDFDEILAGKLGEFDHGVLLRQYTSRADAKAAEHWHGGAFRLFEHKKQKYSVLSYVSEWDSEQSARRYFELYESILRGKWKNIRVTSRSEMEIRGTGDSGDFAVRLAGKTVHSLEGLGGPALAAAGAPANGSPGKRPPLAVN
ncbi:MAG: hypothetical protein ABL995_03690 [Bryobacteraceae bacterium]